MCKMTSTTNGTVHHEGDPFISWPVNRNMRSAGIDPLEQINTGGIGHASGVVTSSTLSDEARIRFEKQYSPGQSKSLSGIATRAFLCGFVLSTSLICAAGMLIFTQSPLWRIPSFIATLSLFHFLEFWTTARYNTRAAQVSSFLFSQNGSAYNIAHTAALLECVLTNVIFPDRKWASALVTKGLILAGVVMLFLGQSVRSIAMVQAGANFNHIVQRRKANEHQLVTSGAYRFLRHPSYFGFFWWGLGTQLVLGNVLCFVGYAFVLWRFFSRRISGSTLFHLLDL